MSTEQLTLIYQPLFLDVIVPERATSGAAGYDVRAYLAGRTVEKMIGLQSCFIEVTGESFTLLPNERAAIPLGFRASLPHGVEAQVRIRSSVAFRKGLFIPNSPATVDPDYPGEWLVLMANPLNEPVTISHQERIAQIVFSRFCEPAWEKGVVEVTTNRIGGLGSTGF